jgi:protein-tyrosine phosphatase
MAEGMLRASLPPDIKVSSAGLSVTEGYPAHPFALRLMADIGIDLTKHRSRLFSAPIALAADLILVMEQSQIDRCYQLVPSLRGRAYLLGHWLPSPPRDIPDPMFHDFDFFLQVFNRIQSSLAGWLPLLTSKAEGSYEHRVSTHRETDPVRTH